MTINNFLLETLLILDDGKKIAELLIKLGGTCRPVLHKYIVEKFHGYYGRVTYYNCTFIGYGYMLWPGRLSYNNTIDSIRHDTVEDFEKHLRERHKNSVQPMNDECSVAFYNEAIKQKSPRKIMLLSFYHYDINAVHKMQGGGVGKLYKFGISNQEIRRVLLNYGLRATYLNEPVNVKINNLLLETILMLKHSQMFKSEYVIRKLSISKINKLVINTIKLLKDGDALKDLLLKLHPSYRQSLRQYKRDKKSYKTRINMHPICIHEKGSVCSSFLLSMRQTSAKGFEELLQNCSENILEIDACCVAFYNEAIRQNSPKKIKLLSQYNFPINAINNYEGGGVGSKFVNDYGITKIGITPECFEVLLDYGLKAEYGYTHVPSDKYGNLRWFHKPFAYDFARLDNKEMMKILIDKRGKNFCIRTNDGPCYHVVYNCESDEMFEMVLKNSRLTYGLYLNFSRFIDLQPSKFIKRELIEEDIQEHIGEEYVGTKDIKYEYVKRAIVENEPECLRFIIEGMDLIKKRLKEKECWNIL